MITRLMIILCILTIFLQAQPGGSLQSGRSQNHKTKTVPIEISKKTTRFFNSLVEGEVEKAFTQMLEGSPIGEKKEQVNSLIAQTKRSIDIYGSLMQYQEVSNELVTSSFLRVRYLGLHSKFPMRWIFTFYNSPETGWIVTNIKFDDLSEYYFEDE